MHVFDTGKGVVISHKMVTAEALHNNSMVLTARRAAPYPPQHIEVPLAAAGNAV